MTYQETKNAIIDALARYDTSYINWDETIMVKWEYMLLTVRNIISPKGVRKLAEYNQYRWDKLKVLQEIKKTI